jgi:hypothetical protein
MMGEERRGGGVGGIIRTRARRGIVVRLCIESAAVLAAVQDAARRLRGCPSGILDRRCARRRRRMQVGTTGWPS